ncbi:ABC transporter substrate-binding protein [Oceanobacter mangrovi]|uniref:ABC transporter substrate-binding protein n=1 Tax=Oceanobacter mangrovi TaxID=2862510 RepID=UPI001C8D0D95|nr:ABC transporter substrate-binding protein [Oceanobacter mangrovi]
MRSGYLAGCLLSLFSTFAFASPAYISPKPLLELPVQYGDVASVRSVSVPVITWPADMKVIHANGDQPKTANASLFQQSSLNLSIERVDSFDTQLENFVSGKSPYLRGTLGMVLASQELLAKHNIKPVVIYQMSWSAGGDALVVKDNIRSLADLKGKTIALQAYGPHVDYMARVLKDAGIGLNEVTLKWLPDLTGTENSPAEALYQQDVDAVFVITPDALALTSDGTVGTGAEGSVKGARIALDTRSANRIIADVYAVRDDYLKRNPAAVEAFVSGLMQADEQVVALMKSRAGGYDKLARGSAAVLFDSANATDEVAGFFADAQLADAEANRLFFNDSNYPRNVFKLADEIQAGLVSLGMLKSAHPVQIASWNFANLAAGVKSSGVSRNQQFDEQKVASLVSQKQKAGTLESDGEFSFEVLFRPNQENFSTDLYGSDFAKAMDMAATYSGAIITVEGHSDPMAWLRAQKEGKSSIVLNRLKQSGKNLSYSRAREVRDAIIAYSNKAGVALDPSQFALVGYGITNPATGICGQDPCAPKTEAQWLSNMRVVFRMIPITAEEDIFKPL